MRTRIDWSCTQRRLTDAGWGTAGIDGIPGKRTYAALLGYVAKRQPDALILAIALSASKALSVFHASDTVERLAEWCAETCHESAGYTKLEENMHYSAARLMAVWPARFPTLASARPFAWDPADPDREDVALANLVYGGRMGNQANGLLDDDGWDHRGGGLVGHTGAAEYKALRDRLGYTPDDVRDPGKAVIAACDFFQRAGTFGFVDDGDYPSARISVNGGRIGLAEVAAGRGRVLKVLCP